MLDSDIVLNKIRLLKMRIEERFPHRNLPNVCEHLEQIAINAKTNADAIDKPIWSLRAGVIVLIVFAIGALLFSLSNVNYSKLGIDTFADVVSVFESGLNQIILMFAGIFFLVSLETRIKRNKTLRILYKLNSLIHVIDMYQLTKDPERLLKNWKYTKSSPKECMSAFELVRYLDYCSEMLSLVSKVASLHIQNNNDPEMIKAVNNIEILTTGLARKIWQKIMIIRGQSLSGIHLQNKS